MDMPTHLADPSAWSNGLTHEAAVWLWGQLSDELEGRVIALRDKALSEIIPWLPLTPLSYEGELLERMSDDLATYLQYSWAALRRQTARPYWKRYLLKPHPAIDFREIARKFTEVFM